MGGWIDPDHRYPHVPATGDTDTSAAAAGKIAPTVADLRDAALAVIRKTPTGLTGSEVAATLGRDWRSVRPRLSELRAMGKIKDSGTRRRNADDNSEIVWVGNG